LPATVRLKPPTGNTRCYLGSAAKQQEPYRMDAAQPPWLNASPQFLLTALLSLGLVVQILGGLLDCFLGYFVCRIALVLAGVALGGGGCAFGLAAAIPTAPPALCVLLGLSGAALCGYICWRLYRFFFALMILAFTVAAFICVVVPAVVPGGKASSADWAVGLILGLGVGVIGFLFARPMMVVSSALSGAATVVLSALALAGLGWPPHPAALVALGLLGCALAAAGMYVQFRLLAHLDDRRAKQEPAASVKRPVRSRPRAPARRVRPALP
jgi:hypothetical protein